MFGHNKRNKRNFSALDDSKNDDEFYHKQIKRNSRESFVANSKISDPSLTPSSDDDNSNADVTTSDEMSSENSASKSKSERSAASKRSIPKRNGSPSFKERRRITSARKKPTPYDRNKSIGTQKSKKVFSSSSDDSSRSTTPDSPFIRQTLKEHCFS